MKIVTTFIYPPIPLREFDWLAYEEDLTSDREGYGPSGYGRTELSALRRFLDDLENDIDWGNDDINGRLTKIMAEVEFHISLLTGECLK